MISDLTPAENVETTDNPQQSQAAPLAGDASSFQKSASTDVLNQNRPIEVVKTGQPISGATAASTGISTAAIVFIIVFSVILVAVASYVFRYVLNRPEPAKNGEKPESDFKRFVGTMRPRGKKKLPRSKRHK